MSKLCRLIQDADVYFAGADRNTGKNILSGPRIILGNGTIMFTEHCETRFCRNHRTVGPAVIRSNGYKEYWVNGKQIPAFEFFTLYGAL